MEEEPADEAQPLAEPPLEQPCLLPVQVCLLVQSACCSRTAPVKLPLSRAAYAVTTATER